MQIYITIGEASRRYSLSRNTLRRMLDDGLIAGDRSPGGAKGRGHRRLSVESLENYFSRSDSRVMEILRGIKF